MAFYVYILASRKNGTLYVGMTDNLIHRVWMHRNGVVEGFTKKHGVKLLVWYEQHETRESAFVRERQLKKWNRIWKLELIERTNPAWADLYESLSVRKCWVPAFAGTSGSSGVLREKARLAVARQ
jgi:putative endonuclease